METKLLGALVARQTPVVQQTQDLAALQTVLPDGNGGGTGDGDAVVRCCDYKSRLIGNQLIDNSR